MCREQVFSAYVRSHRVRVCRWIFDVSQTCPSACNWNFNEPMKFIFWGHLQHLFRFSRFAPQRNIEGQWIRLLLSFFIFSSRIFQRRYSSLSQYQSTFRTSQSRFPSTSKRIIQCHPWTFRMTDTRVLLERLLTGRLFIRPSSTNCPGDYWSILLVPSPLLHSAIWCCMVQARMQCFHYQSLSTSPSLFKTVASL